MVEFNAENIYLSKKHKARVLTMMQEASVTGTDRCCSACLYIIGGNRTLWEVRSRIFRNKFNGRPGLFLTEGFTLDDAACYLNRHELALLSRALHLFNSWNFPENVSCDTLMSMDYKDMLLMCIAEYVYGCGGLDYIE